MHAPKSFLNVLVGTSALVFAGAHIAPARHENGPVLNAAVEFVTSAHATTKGADAMSSTNVVMTEAKSAVDAFGSMVHPLSHPKALEAAFRGYFAYKTTHPAEVLVGKVHRVVARLDELTVADLRGLVFG